MRSDLLRPDHVRKILQLYREVESIPPGHDQKLHLVAGLERIVGGALAVRAWTKTSARTVAVGTPASLTES
jgi:hypothetical protein